MTRIHTNPAATWCTPALPCVRCPGDAAGLYFRRGKPQCTRVSIRASPPPPVGWGWRPHGEVQRHEIEGVFQIHFFLYDKYTMANTDSAGLIVTTDNRLLYAQHGTVQTRKRMLAWAVHVMNFLSSPSVKLVFQEPSAALYKKRQRSGKESLPGFYEITYRRLIKDYNKNKISQKAYTHRFRYRVRGHFKRFTWGGLVGGIWCPDEIRGLAYQRFTSQGYAITCQN
jgi:hypothetical protein